MMKLLNVDEIKLMHDRGERLKLKIFAEGDLTQHEKTIFKVKNISYLGVDHYLLAQRAKLFKDDEMLEKIMSSKSIRQANLFGKKIRDFDSKEWDKHKLNMSYVANLCKFSQDENLKFELLQTEEEILVNADVYDPVWGIGKKITDLDIKNPHSWKGENLLGFVLMKVREDLKRKAK